MLSKVHKSFLGPVNIFLHG